MEQQYKYKRLSAEEESDNHVETSRIYMAVGRAYERALSKVIEIEVKTRIMEMREEEEHE